MKFLICTDVAARGIDVNGLPFGECTRIVYGSNLHIDVVAISHATFRVCHVTWVYLVLDIAASSSS